MIKEFDNKLMIPETIKLVDDIPKLGSGKKDYVKAKELLERPLNIPCQSNSDRRNPITPELKF